MGKIYPGRPIARIGCDTDHHCRESAVQVPTSQNTNYFSRAMVPVKSTTWVRCLWGWLCGNIPMWPAAFHWVYRHWRLLWGASQGQLLPVFCPESSGISYKEVCSWLLPVLGLEVPWHVQGQLLLALGLGPLSNRHKAHWGQMLLVSENLGKYEARVKTRYSHGRGTGNSLNGPGSWVGRSLRESFGWGKQC